MTATVAIIQRRMTHYRLPLFEQLRGLLAHEAVNLRVLHGDAKPAEATKNDSGVLPWAEHLPTHYLAGERICWQPFMHRVRDCDLVVVTQENKLVNNLPPLLMNPWRRQKLAFWGHGRDMQARNPDSLPERFKRWTTRRVDWWFAYTEVSAGFVRETGFPSSRITVLNNSIDTSELRAAVEQARGRGRAALRAELGLAASAPVGLFVGSLYAEKRIPWLLAAAERMHRLMPDFQLLVAGAGPEAALVQAAAASSPAVRYMGVVRGARKAELLAAADVMLNPGLVGLSILDAFVAGLPMLTTDCHLHSPEIAYLTPRRNGLMTEDNLESYVDACVSLLTSPSDLALLQSGAHESGHTYSIENMAARFSAGIVRCLAAGTRHPS